MLLCKTCKAPVIGQVDAKATVRLGMNLFDGALIINPTVIESISNLNLDKIQFRCDSCKRDLTADEISLRCDHTGNYGGITDFVILTSQQQLTSTGRMSGKSVTTCRKELLILKTAVEDVVKSLNLPSDGYKVSKLTVNIL